MYIIQQRANSYRFLGCGEYLEHRCCRKVHYVRTVTQPDIDAVVGYNYCIQIIEHRVCQILPGLSQDQA
jgi:hypothetical protein